MKELPDHFPPGAAAVWPTNRPASCRFSTGIKHQRFSSCKQHDKNSRPEKYMNLTKLISSVAIAGAIIFGRTAAPAAEIFSGYPLVKLSISGTFYLTANSTNTQNVPLKKMTYNTQTLINLLNASPSATNMLQTVTGKSQIPPGSYFLWDLSEEELYVTNKNGFFFPLFNSSPF